MSLGSNYIEYIYVHFNPFFFPSWDYSSRVLCCVELDVASVPTKQHLYGGVSVGTTSTAAGDTDRQGKDSEDSIVDDATATGSVVWILFPGLEWKTKREE